MESSKTGSNDSTSPFRTLLKLSSATPALEQTSTEDLQIIHKQGTHALEYLHSSIGTLGKFLFIGVQDKEIGIIKEEDISEMAWHIHSLGELCGEVFSLKESALIELAKRKEDIRAI